MDSRRWYFLKDSKAMTSGAKPKKSTGTQTMTPAKQRRRKSQVKLTRMDRTMQLTTTGQVFRMSLNDLLTKSSRPMLPSKFLIPLEVLESITINTN